MIDVLLSNVKNLLIIHAYSLSDGSSDLLIYICCNNELALIQSILTLYSGTKHMNHKFKINFVLWYKVLSFQILKLVFCITNNALQTKMWF